MELDVQHSGERSTGFINRALTDHAWVHGYFALKYDRLQALEARDKTKLSLKTFYTV